MRQIIMNVYVDWVIENPEKAAEQIGRLIVIERHRDILAMHMAEVKAIADGSIKNTLTDVVGHCLKEINELNLTL